MTKVQQKRIAKLLAYLKELPEHKFSIESFHSCRSTDPKIIKKSIKHQCGTTACVVGHMPIVFPRHFKYGGFSMVLGANTSISLADNLKHCFGDIGWTKIIFSSAYDTKDVSISHVIQRIEECVAAVK